MAEDQGRNQAALGWVCEQLAGVRGLADRAGKRAELDPLLASLRLADRDLMTLMDEIEALLRRCGWGGTIRGEIPDLGLGPGIPLEEAYLCPREAGRQCARTVLTFDVKGGAVPSCALHGIPMRLERLDP
ncbi:hypothetical protein ACIHCQ_18445 [Streptomyces sp. NPDC052236]|uniref:hypothetical protein n=1 Tax=Streptomyces sp. NPDC052236 TaxID=3365686 RepID=UPI0037D8285B